MGAESGPEPEPDPIDTEDAVEVEDGEDVKVAGDSRDAGQIEWQEREFKMDEHQVRRAARDAADTFDGAESEEREQARKTAADDTTT